MTRRTEFDKQGDRNAAAFRAAIRRRWLVTLLDRGHELTVEVPGITKTDAKRRAKELHPQGHVVYVEATRDYS